MRATYITACVIGVLVVIWLASGQLKEKPEPPAKNIAEQNSRVAAMAEERPPTRVRVATVHASEQSRLLTIRGRTQNKRAVIVQSQIGGLVVERTVERGDYVDEGELLCKISVEDREAMLRQAEATAEQAQIEYEGSLKLSKQGLQSATVIAQTKARLAAAEAGLRQAQLDMERLNITAPFNGVVERIHMEEGQYVTPGSACVTLVDLDPMLLIGQVAETELPFLQSGQLATARLSDGRSVQGIVTFIAKTAEEGTRTYQVEMHVENHELDIPGGVTAQITLPVQTIMAQKISPALLILDDKGQIGVRTINSDNLVEFNPVEIINDESDGIWVSGLPDVARIIVVGQQLVVAGELVEPTHEPLSLVGGADNSEERAL